MAKTSMNLQSASYSCRCIVFFTFILGFYVSINTDTEIKILIDTFVPGEFTERGKLHG